jgi:hypothetical protein
MSPTTFVGTVPERPRAEENTLRSRTFPSLRWAPCSTQQRRDTRHQERFGADNDNESQGFSTEPAQRRRRGFPGSLNTVDLDQWALDSAAIIGPACTTEPPFTW